SEDIKLDGASVGSAAWGAPLPIDPGTHEISAKAPGKKKWLTTLALSQSEKRSVTVPSLETEDTTAPTPTATTSAPATHTAPPPPAETKPNGRSAAGWVIGGAGVVAIGVGS